MVAHWNVGWIKAERPKVMLAHGSAGRNKDRSPHRYCGTLQCRSDAGESPKKVMVTHGNVMGRRAEHQNVMVADSNVEGRKAERQKNIVAHGGLMRGNAEHQQIYISTSVCV